MKRKRTLFVLLTAIFVFTEIFLAGGNAWGQRIILNNGRPVRVGAEDEKAGEDAAAAIFIAPDRAKLQALTQAKELLEKGRYSEAVRNLDAILEGKEDYFIQPSKDHPIPKSMKSEAQRMIGEMSPEGRASYESNFGDRARAALNEAVAKSSISDIEEVARRYFHTKAGCEAAFLLGLHHLDHSRPLAAALILQRIQTSLGEDRQFEPILPLALASSWLQAEEIEKAKTVLIDFKKRNADRQLIVGGKTVSLFSNDDDAIEWLLARIGPLTARGAIEADRWIMFRGDPQRNAESPGSPPLLNLRWEAISAVDPSIDQAMQSYFRAKVDAEKPLLPSSHPLVVDDVVLMRSYRNLVALDFITGKRIWEIPVEESTENDKAPEDYEFFAPRSRYYSDRSGMDQGIGGVIHRTYDDSLYGTMSSDGRLVFSIEESGPMGSVSQRANMIAMRRGNANAAGVSNYLAARDIRTGKLKWALGGPKEPAPLYQAETFFLGPPLPLQGLLYAIGEYKGEIRLFAIDPDSEKKMNRILWSQQLAATEQSNREDVTRRNIGFSPSYADGILVCPTSIGAVVAVDLATRSLLWGYHYANDSRNAENINNYNENSTHWTDASLSLVSGRVVMSPIYSENLYCLNLTDGEVKWKIPRAEGLFVACIHKSNVIVVGAKKMHAYRLDDGKPAWDGRTIDFPEGVLASGRGFTSGDKYFLPLNSAEVAMIDLNEGKIERISQSQKGSIPGNLVCYKGRILSQNYRALDSFYQLDAAAKDVADRLAANPRDAAALCLQGEILLDSGDRAKAIDCYRQALEIAGETRTKILLRDTLLDGLRTDFATYRLRNEEIEKLLDNPLQRATYLQVTTAGLQAAGEFEAAFDRCQELIALDNGRFPLEPISKKHSVRRDRWIQARLDSLRAAANEELAARMDAIFSERRKSAISEGTPEALRAYLDYYGNLPMAAEVRTAWIEKLKKSGRPIDVEMAILQSQPVLGLPRNGSAMVETAEFFRQIGQEEAAAASYRWLLSRFGDRECRDGKTGKQLVEALDKDDSLRKEIEHRSDWPTGKVEANVDSKRENNYYGYGRTKLEVRENCGPFFDNANLMFDTTNTPKIQCTDALGAILWNFPMPEEYMSSGSMNGESWGVRTWGHVLLLPLGGRLTAIDTLGADKTHAPKVLWSEEGEPQDGNSASQPVGWGNARVIMMNMQQGGMIESDSMPGDANFIANRYLCVQRSRTLRALNTMDGQTLWERQGIPLSSTIFGDDDYVFVLPPNKQEAMVFRALDGEPLGTKKVERRETRAQTPNNSPFVENAQAQNEFLAAYGRNLLFWRSKGGRRTPELFDVWEQKSVWTGKTYSSKTKCTLVNGELLGILEASGKFTLLSVPEGRTLAEAQLEPENNLTDLYVIPGEDGYLVLTHSTPRLTLNSVQTRPVGDQSDKQVSRGRLYAIDRNGKLLWPHSVKISNQYLVENQPKGFPVLIFASMIYEQSNNQGRFKLAIQLIDKRTGREVFANKDLPESHFLRVTADATKKTMQMLMQSRAITFTFTDKPWPTAEEIEKAKVEEKAKKPPKSIFRAMKKAAEDAVKPRGFIPEEEDPFGG